MASCPAAFGWKLPAPGCGKVSPLPVLLGATEALIHLDRGVRFASFMPGRASEHRLRVYETNARALMPRRPACC